MNAEKLKSISQYVKKYEPIRFQQFITLMDGKLNSTPRHENQKLFNTKNFAFLSLAKRSGHFTSFQFGSSSKRYADKSFELAASIDERKEDVHSAGFSSKGEGGFFTMSLCVAYDWSHGDWTEDQKREIADKIITAYTNRDKEGKIGGRQKLGMNMIAHSYQTGITGIALYGDTFLGKDKLINEMVDDVQSIWLDRILKLAENYAGYPDGMAGWSEGASYMKSASFSIAWMAAALSPALQRNLNAEFNFIKTFPLYLFFYSNPLAIQGPEYKNHFMQRNGAVSISTFNENMTLQQFLCTTSMIKEKDPKLAGFYRWILSKSYAKFPDLEMPAYNDPEINDLFFSFIFGIKDVAAISPEDANIKHAYRFGYGDVSIRSSFTPQATKLTFWTPSFYGFRHGTNNTTALFFHKYGELSTKAGISKSDSDLPKGGSQSVLGHNSAAFYNGKNHTYGYKRKSNDFAETWNHKDNKPGGKNELGLILAQSFNHGTYDFISFDYTPSYKRVNFLAKGIRKVLYLHDPASPNYKDNEFVLLYDYSHITDSLHQRRFLFSANEKPEVLAGEWNSPSTGQFTVSSEKTLRFQTNFANTHGAMLLKRLYPAAKNVSYSMVGDEAGDYWFRDASGKDLTKRKVVSDWAGYWAMKYRFEMHDKSKKPKAEFLTLFQIGDSNTLVKMQPAELIKLSTHFGVVIGSDRVAFVNRKNLLVKNIKYTLKDSGKRLHVITGLANGRYAIRVDNKPLETVKTNDHTLSFYATGTSFSVKMN
ncbi:MAG: hypothetical protein ACRBF0_09105 [Calditrichia bacterium]